MRNLGDVYEKKGIKVESNPYLSGVSNIQTTNVWKKLMDEKTICEWMWCKNDVFKIIYWNFYFFGLKNGKIK